MQALGDAGIEAPLWVLTRGAVAAGPGEALTSPVQALAWGLGRVAALEHPDRWGGLIDLPPDPAAADRRGNERGTGRGTAARLCAVLAGCGEDQVAIRPTGTYGPAPGPRPGRAAGATPDRRPLAAVGTVLVTGGTGAIGGHVAPLAGRARTPRVVLASRSGPAARAWPRWPPSWPPPGPRSTSVACDTARPDDLAGLLARLAARARR